MLSSTGATDDLGDRSAVVLRALAAPTRQVPQQRAQAPIAGRPPARRATLLRALAIARRHFDLRQQSGSPRCDRHLHAIIRGAAGLSAAAAQARRGLLAATVVSTAGATGTLRKPFRVDLLRPLTALPGAAGSRCGRHSLVPARVWPRLASPQPGRCGARLPFHGHDLRGFGNLRGESARPAAAPR